jgi:ankyrin repeat protein
MGATVSKFGGWWKDEANKGGQTALWRASDRGKVDEVKKLLADGARVSQADVSGRTPLVVAIESGHAEVVRCLLDAGANLNRVDKFGNTVLDLAFHGIQSKEAVVRCLLERGMDPNTGNQWPPLFSASRKGHTSVVQCLLEYGADVQAVAKYSGNSALHFASEEGHAEVAQLLLSAGADIHARCNHGSTPLHVASMNGKVQIISCLLDHGAEIGARDGCEASPLHSASAFGNVEAVSFFLKNGAAANATNERGWTPLHFASGCEWDPESVVRYRWSEEHLEVVRRLVECGADCRKRDNDGRLPSDYARRWGYPEMEHFLLEAFQVEKCRSAALQVVHAYREMKLPKEIGQMIAKVVWSSRRCVDWGPCEERPQKKTKRGSSDSAGGWFASLWSQ